MKLTCHLTWAFQSPFLSPRTFLTIVYGERAHGEANKVPGSRRVGQGWGGKEHGYILRAP